MPARLYLRAQPRAFYLLTDTHALVFRQPGAGESKASRSVVVAEFLPLEEIDTIGLIPAGRGSGGSVEGVLGVTSVPTVPEVFLLLLTSSTPLASLVPGSSLRPARVVSVEFHSLTSNFWDPPNLQQDTSLGGFDDLEDDDPYNYHRPGQQSGTLSQAQAAGIEDPTSGMRKYLESGGFFYAEGCRWDVSARLGGNDGNSNWVAAEEGRGPSPLEAFDERFVWNASLLAPFLAFRLGLSAALRAELDAHALLVPVIQGFICSAPIMTMRAGVDEPPATLALISRLSWKRAGARFRTRGIDDDGNVANFVETETILTTGSTCVSYVQIRGSVPLFWQQPSQGIQTLQQRVEISRPPQATQPAFDKHFLELLSHYDAVHAINLLGQKDAEAMLSAAYADHFNALRLSLRTRDDGALFNSDTLVYTPYDFHAVVRTGGHEAVRAELSTMHEVMHSLTNFEYSAVDTSSGVVIERQHGVFRVNCLDCLDRTNFVQEVLSTNALRHFLSDNSSPLLNSPTLWAAHRELWADNGDRLSKTYAGTGALNTSATRTGRKTFAGLLSDATKSVSRAYINNFQDKGKQNAIDMLLGLMAGQRAVVLFDPVGDSVQSALQARKSEYSVPRDLTLFAGTYNVNGKLPNEPLDPWLFPDSTRADVYLIAFQEIVELTPQQIVQPDPAKKRVWEGHIKDVFKKHSGPHEYILMRSEQQVGTALMVVVKSSLLPHIRNIEFAEKKTGLQGLSGNKGGVGLRFDLYDTGVCLMTCHLAAGQSNYADRNADYRTIWNGLKFLRGKTIDSHDIVIWAADFNYRIDMANDEVRECATTDQLDHLFAADQLSLARDDGEVFLGYQEGPIAFRPTYKYDNGTDEYDTSEKQRIPAWTDRVLYKGPKMKLEAYNCAQLKVSDHRPVYAILTTKVDEINEHKKSRIADEIAQRARKSGGEKLDERVELASQGGLRGLVKEFTAVSLEPSPVSSRKSTPPPITRDHKPPPKPSAGSALYNVVNSAYNRLGQPPPLPARNGAASPASSIGSASASRRTAPPPPASDFRKIGLPPKLSPSSSAELTPVATGDFVIVPSPARPALPARKNSGASSIFSMASTGSGPPTLPPRLPARPGSAATPPVKKGTLDIDGPAPDSLALPVLKPDRSPGDSTVSLPPVPGNKPPLPTAPILAAKAAALPDKPAPPAISRDSKPEKTDKLPPPTISRDSKPLAAEKVPGADKPTPPVISRDSKPSVISTDATKSSTTKVPPPVARERKPSMDSAASPAKSPAKAAPALAPKPTLPTAAEAEPEAEEKMDVMAKLKAFESMNKPADKPKPVARQPSGDVHNRKPSVSAESKPEVKPKPAVARKPSVDAAPEVKPKPATAKKPSLDTPEIKPKPVPAKKPSLDTAAPEIKPKPTLDKPEPKPTLDKPQPARAASMDKAAPTLAPKPATLKGEAKGEEEKKNAKAAPPAVAKPDGLRSNSLKSL